MRIDTDDLADHRFKSARSALFIGMFIHKAIPEHIRRVQGLFYFLYSPATAETILMKMAVRAAYSSVGVWKFSTRYALP